MSRIFFYCKVHCEIRFYSTFCPKPKNLGNFPKLNDNWFFGPKKRSTILKSRFERLKPIKGADEFFL